MAKIWGKIVNFSINNVRRIIPKRFLPQDGDIETVESDDSDFANYEKSDIVSTGVIMLIIPADKTTDINEGHKINTETAIRLIDYSVYFGCFSENKGDEIEKEFNLQKDKILSDTVQDIYVRLDTAKGADLIEKISKFSLKKQLQNNPREFAISKIRVLEERYGLEKLNRI